MEGSCSFLMKDVITLFFPRKGCHKAQNISVNIAGLPIGFWTHDFNPFSYKTFNCVFTWLFGYSLLCFYEYKMLQWST